MDSEPDPNWAKFLDPDPNLMYLDPQHCLYVGLSGDASSDAGVYHSLCHDHFGGKFYIINS